MKSLPVRVGVHLTSPELHLSGAVGLWRQIQAVEQGRVSRYGNEAGGPWQTHLLGAFWEMSTAKGLDRFWSGNIGDLNAADVGEYEVRGTLHPQGRLPLHPRDPDGAVFILVVGGPPDCVLVGWLLGREGKLPQYWDEPQPGRGAFFVPQSDLHPMTTLPRGGLDGEA